MVVSQTIASGQVEYFVIKPELFVALAGRMPDQLDAPLHDFLALRPDDAVPTVSTAGNPAADAGLAEEVGARLDVHLGIGHHRLGLVVDNDTPRLVYDPQRGAPDAYYVIAGRDFDNVTWGGAPAAVPGVEVEAIPAPAEPEPPPITPVGRGDREKEDRKPGRPREIVRYPEATFPEWAATGKFSPLRVVITPRAVAGATGLVLRTPAGQEPPDAFEVTVFLEAPAFEIAPEPGGRVWGRLTAGRKSKTVGRQAG